MPEEARTLHPNRARSANVRKLVSMGMLCAIAYAVMFLSKVIFAPLTVAGFLTFDLKDVIIAIGGFIYGPLSAVVISVVVSVIEMFTVSETGPIGLLMNILATVAFVCPAAFFYKKRHSIPSVVSGLVLGGILMTIVMLLWNYLITPLYMLVPREAVVGMLVPIFLPFNLVKATMNGALTMLLYKPVVSALRAARLVPEHQGGKGKFKASVSIIGIIVLATGVLLALVLAGKI